MGGTHIYPPPVHKQRARERKEKRHVTRERDTRTRTRARILLYIDSTSYYLHVLSTSTMYTYIVHSMSYLLATRYEECTLYVVPCTSTMYLVPRTSTMYPCTHVHVHTCIVGLRYTSYQSMCHVAVRDVGLLCTCTSYDVLRTSYLYHRRLALPCTLIYALSI